jgi:hypothetical protein
MRPLDEVHAWAASGAMSLTGRTAGSPCVAPGPVAGYVDAALREFDQTLRTLPHGQTPLPASSLLAERAALLKMQRQGPSSCGGAFRTIATADGFWGLSLPRPDDIRSVPALLSTDDVPDPWAAVEAWSIEQTTTDVVARGRLLGLACAPLLQSTTSTRPPILLSDGVSRSVQRERPLVIDLTSLWAGPLCAHLLGLRGCDIIKVESSTRPDGTRSTPAFFDLLHYGHDMIAVDFSSHHDVDELLRLMHGADLVLEASRPRALAQHGIVADELVQAGVSWLSITAYGRSVDAIGFGDDVGCGAGLTVLDQGVPMPVGDAVADPLTGVAAALAAARSLTHDWSQLIDISMHDVSRAVVGAVPEHSVTQRDGTWWVETSTGRSPVAPPTARRPAGAARPLGLDTHRWLS